MHLRDRKRVLKQLNLRFLAWFIVDADNIKPERWIVFVFTQKLPRHTGEITLLLSVNRRFRRLYVTRGARLDLNKAERVAVPSHQVQFATAARAAIVARDHDVSLASQIKISFFFTAASRVQVLWAGAIVRQESGHKVEGAESEMRERAGHGFFFTSRGPHK